MFQCLNAKFDIGATSETNVLTGNKSFVWRWDTVTRGHAKCDSVFQRDSASEGIINLSIKLVYFQLTWLSKTQFRHFLLNEMMRDIIKIACGYNQREIKANAQWKNI